jgi:hypothetical protein
VNVREEQERRSSRPASPAAAPHLTEGGAEAEGVAVVVGVGTLQPLSETASVFSTPTHGSGPRDDAATEHVDLPTQSARTAADAPALVQFPAVKPFAHEPCSVPKSAKATDVNAPDTHDSVNEGDRGGSERFTHMTLTGEGCGEGCGEGSGPAAVWPTDPAAPIRLMPAAKTKRMHSNRYVPRLEPIEC